jgi:hypothetical protein
MFLVNWTMSLEGKMYEIVPTINRHQTPCVIGALGTAAKANAGGGHST